MKKVFIIFFLLSLLTVFTFAGNKEEFAKVEASLMTLQNSVQMLQNSVIKSGTTNETLLRQMIDTLSKITITLNDVAKMKGEQNKNIDENFDDLASDVNDLSSKVSQLNDRLKKMEDEIAEIKGLILSMKMHKPTEGVGVDGKPLPLSPDKLYAMAYNDYLQGNYELAIQGFLDYLSKYGDTEYADNAQYYIGDSLFNQKRYNDAIEAFNKVVANYPKGDKAPAALLKAGLAYIEMNDTNSAISKFKEVIKKYPKSAEAKIAEQQLEILGVKNLKQK